MTSRHSSRRDPRLRLVDWTPPYNADMFQVHGDPNTTFWGTLAGPRVEELQGKRATNRWLFIHCWSVSYNDSYQVLCNSSNTGVANLQGFVRIFRQKVDTCSSCPILAVVSIPVLRPLLVDESFR